MLRPVHHEGMNPTTRATGSGLTGVLIAAACAVGADAQAPLTRAERTDYAETSRYDDVMAFLDAVAAPPRLHRATFGYSQRGRPLPLVAGGRGITSATAGEVRAAGGTVMDDALEADPST